jgi:hypothetical protein
MYFTARTNPAAVGAVIVAGRAALPAIPTSFWDYTDCVMNAEENQNGSRAVPQSAPFHEAG